MIWRRIRKGIQDYQGGQLVWLWLELLWQRVFSVRASLWVYACAWACVCAVFAVCVCVCVCLCVYVSVSVPVSVLVSVSVCVSVCEREAGKEIDLMHMHICVCADAWEYMHIYTCVCMCVRMCVQVLCMLEKEAQRESGFVSGCVWACAFVRTRALALYNFMVHIIWPYDFQKLLGTNWVLNTFRFIVSVVDEGFTVMSMCLCIRACVCVFVHVPALERVCVFGSECIVFPLTVLKNPSRSTIISSFRIILYVQAAWRAKMVDLRGGVAEGIQEGGTEGVAEAEGTVEATETKSGICTCRLLLK